MLTFLLTAISRRDILQPYKYELKLIFQKWYILRCRDIIFQNTLNEPYVKLIQIMENHADFSNILNKNLGGIKRYDKD